MSTTNTATTKKSLKFIEIPLNKFKDEVIPYHENILYHYRGQTLMLIESNKVKQAAIRVVKQRSTVKQLKDLLYEFDTLRAQVEDCSLDAFDVKTLPLRKSIMDLLAEYSFLDKMTMGLNDFEYIEFKDNPSENPNPFRDISELQMEENLSEVRLKQAKAILDEIENLNQEIEDLHDIHSNLNEMVADQGEDFEHIEKSVESTHENVQSGLKHLVKAHNLKATCYPVTGAVLGGLIGGPVGAVAGLKIGGMVALGCALTGYIGGRYFKKVNDQSTEEHGELEEDLGVEKKDM